MSGHLHVFVMAGGSGERFWPMSRTTKPKHLLRLLGDRTMLEITVRRLEGVVPWDRVFVLTNAAQAGAVRDELPFLARQNILIEPEKRDTAPACALAAGFARARDSQAICALLPADAMIHNVPTFQRQLLRAAEIATESDALVTFAIPPTYPATGFGYLHLGPTTGGIANVLRFVEKPDEPTAETYFASGHHAWNAGMFVWRSEIFLRETMRLQPLLGAFIEEFPSGDATEYLNERFASLPKISVDYAIMEQASAVLALPALFDWDDVGAWTALPSHLGRDEDGNTVRGQIVQYDSKNSIAVSNGRLIALCGVEDLVVVETSDAILVCHRDAVQDIKKLQGQLPQGLK